MTLDTKNLLNWGTWFRGIIIVLLGVATYYLFYYVVSILAIIQFVITLVSGSQNEQLKGFGDMLATFISDSVHYITYASDTPPAPFDQFKVEKKIKKGK
ncbi:MAG: DUF4389 domain-containing protein [Pseudomonadota bacterium]|nr:DUF4389 domain-containing protein [Pseudomonadota bacterium]|tara:strand:- start:63 stop:359 length:297 start_codon:yes stop_codon:yes gene_type:complete